MNTIPLPLRFRRRFGIAPLISINPVDCLNARLSFEYGFLTGALEDQRLVRILNCAGNMQRKRSAGNRYITFIFFPRAMFTPEKQIQRLCRYGDSVQDALRERVPLLSVRGYAAHGSSWSRMSEELESSIPYNLRRSD